MDTAFFEPFNLMTLLPLTSMPEKFEPYEMNENPNRADTMFNPEAWRVYFDLNQVRAIDYC